MLYSKYNTHVWFLKDSFYWVIQAYFFHCFISKEFWNLAQAFVASTEITFPLYSVKGSPDSSVGKESTCNAGDPSSISGSGRFAGEGIGYPLQYSWTSLVAQLVKNLPATWERRPGFDSWVGKIPWKRERLPIPVFWPGEFYGLYSPWGYKESDITERLSLHTVLDYCLIE